MVRVRTFVNKTATEYDDTIRDTEHTYTKDCVLCRHQTFDVAPETFVKYHKEKICG